jgi:hypothetical protein
MAWSKLDEDRAADNEPWSAFLLKGLTDNANAYAAELAPGFSAAWSYEHPPKWASMLAFAGTTVVFNCGRNATACTFALNFDHHPTLTGYLMISHPDTGASVVEEIPGGTAVVSMTLTLPNAVNGPQEFQVLYKSSVAEESLGHFHCFTAIGNQIAVRNGTLTAVGSAGRQFWAVQLAGSNVDAGAPMPPGGFHTYQVGRVNPILNIGGGQHADGYLITWPDVETNPPILRSTSTFVQQVPNYVQGDIFELSWISLLGVAFKVTANQATTVPMVYAHDLAQSVGVLPRSQRLFAGNNLIQVAACAAKDRGFLGCLVGPGAPMTHLFASDEGRTVDLMFRMRFMRFNNFLARLEGTLSVVEVTPGPVFTPIITYDLGQLSPPAVRGRQTVAQVGFVTTAVNGIFLGADAWGMADAAFSLDLSNGQIFTQRLSFPVSRVTTGAIYAIQFETTAEVYLASFYLGGE